MHVCCVVEDLEGRGLKRENIRAIHHERRRVPRKTGDGACRDNGGGMEVVERKRSDGKPEALSLLRAR